MTGRFLTLHPQEDKQGTNIDRRKYDSIRAAILGALGEQGEIAQGDLPGAVEERMGADSAGSISWYVTTVKLDLEARDLIERVAGKTQQHLRLVDEAAWGAARA